MLSLMKVHLSSQQLAKEHLHLARKVTSFVKKTREPEDYLITACNLLEKRSARSFQTAGGERDMESDETGENHEIPPDSEEEGNLTGVTTIWSRRRPVRPPRHMEDFF